MLGRYTALGEPFAKLATHYRTVTDKIAETQGFLERIRAVAASASTTAAK